MKGIIKKWAVDGDYVFIVAVNEKGEAYHYTEYFNVMIGLPSVGDPVTIPQNAEKI